MCYAAGFVLLLHVYGCVSSVIAHALLSILGVQSLPLPSPPPPLPPLRTPHETTLGYVSQETDATLDVIQANYRAAKYSDLTFLQGKIGQEGNAAAADYPKLDKINHCKCAVQVAGCIRDATKKKREGGRGRGGERETALRCGYGDVPMRRTVCVRVCVCVCVCMRAS